MMEQNRHGTLEQIKAVWTRWGGSRHRLRSSHAMVEINGILIAAKVREKRLRAISDTGGIGMREFKFRGQTLKGWVYGNLNVLRQKFRNVDPGTYISNSGGAPFAYQVRPETVGQYIGYADMNNVDIYEGDILRDSFDRILFVGWHRGGFYFKALTETNFEEAHVISQWFEFDRELPLVVGNRYEDQEELR